MLGLHHLLRNITAAQHTRVGCEHKIGLLGVITRGPPQRQRALQVDGGGDLWIRGVLAMQRHAAGPKRGQLLHQRTAAHTEEEQSESSPGSTSRPTPSQHCLAPQALLLLTTLLARPAPAPPTCPLSFHFFSGVMLISLTRCLASISVPSASSCTCATDSQAWGSSKGSVFSAPDQLLTGPA